MLDPRFFRSAPFAGSVLTAISATAAIGGFLFLATLYLQEVRALSAVSAGLHLLPMATMVALGAVVSSRVLARRGARLPMLAAGLGLATGRRAAVPADRDLSLLFNPCCQAGLVLPVLSGVSP